MKDRLRDGELAIAILKEVEAMNLENALKGAPVYTLLEMLSEKNVMALREIGKRYAVKGYYKLIKQDLINAIYEKMQDVDRLVEVLYSLEGEEWDFFKKVVAKKHLQENNVYLDSYERLYAFGILGLYYNEGKFYFVIPEEIKKVYKKIEKTVFSEKKSYYDLLNHYAKAATHLYGVITQADLVLLFNSQNEQQTSAEELCSILLKYHRENRGYCFWNDYIVNDAFENNDFKDVEYYVEAAALKPRYMLEKEELLKYANSSYFEATPQIMALIEYIDENLCQDPDETDEIVEEIHFLCFAQAKQQEILDVFHNHNIVFELEQIQKLMEHLMEVNNNTRLWLNNGHTPREIAEKPFQSAKIGRNEPCPCGSGKKYKKCCGIIA